MAKTGVINARVDQSVRDRLQKYCENKKIKMAVIVEEALSQWLDANEHNEHNTSIEHNTTQCTQQTETLTREDIDAIVDDRVNERLEQLKNDQTYLIEEKVESAIVNSEQNKEYPAERLVKLIYENTARINQKEIFITQLTQTQKQHESQISDHNKQLERLWLQKMDQNDRRNIEKKLENLEVSLEQLQNTPSENAPQAPITTQEAQEVTPTRKADLIKSIAQRTEFYHLLQNSNNDRLATAIIQALNQNYIFEKGKKLETYKEREQLVEKLGLWRNGKDTNDAKTLRSKYYWARQLFDEIRAFHTDVNPELEK